MSNKIGVAAIIFGIAALITAIGTTIINFMSFKWAAKVWEPFGRLVKKSEPMMDKMLTYSDKALDQYISNMEDD